jgi:hypothetical protein
MESVFTRTCYWTISWARWIQSTASPPIYLKSISVLFVHWCLGVIRCLFPSGSPIRSNNWSVKCRHQSSFCHEFWKYWYIASLNTWACSVPVLNSVEELAVALLHIQVVPGYCLSLEVFCDFLRFVEANAKIVLQIRWRTVLSTSLQFIIYELSCQLTLHILGYWHHH